MRQGPVATDEPPYRAYPVASWGQKQSRPRQGRLLVLRLDLSSRTVYLSPKSNVVSTIGHLVTHKLGSGYF